MHAKGQSVRAPEEWQRDRRHSSECPQSAEDWASCGFETARSCARGCRRQNDIVTGEDLLKTLIEALDVIKCEIVVNRKTLLSILDHVSQRAAQLVSATRIFAREALGEIGLHDCAMPLNGLGEPIRQGDFRHVAADLLGKSCKSLLRFGVCLLPDRRFDESNARRRGRWLGYCVTQNGTCTPTLVWVASVIDH